MFHANIMVHSLTNKHLVPQEQLKQFEQFRQLEAPAGTGEHSSERVMFFFSIG